MPILQVLSPLTQYVLLSDLYGANLNALSLSLYIEIRNQENGYIIMPIVSPCNVAHSDLMQINLLVFHEKASQKKISYSY